jgi:hypothetical protein
MSKITRATKIPVALVALAGCLAADVRSSAGSWTSGPELLPDGTMDLTTLGDGSLRVDVDVTNVGDEPAAAASWSVWIDGQALSGRLYLYPGGAPAPPGALNPQDRGYIVLNVPAGTFARCQTHDAVIGVTAWSPPPSANHRSVATPCLTWDTPITERELGHPPEPITLGETLDDIVSSRRVARKSDGFPCNHCHFAGSKKPYSPPSGDIRPDQSIGGQTWAQGWAQAFVALPDSTKPPYLKDIVQQWLQDGAR